MNGFNRLELMRVSRHSELLGRFQQVVDGQLPLFEEKMLLGVVVDHSKIAEARNVNRISQSKLPAVKVAKLIKLAIERFAHEKLSTRVHINAFSSFSR